MQEKKGSFILDELEGHWALHTVPENRLFVSITWRADYTPVPPREVTSQELSVHS